MDVKGTHAGKDAAAEIKQEVDVDDNKRKIEVLGTIVEKTTGTVKWYNTKLLYGFINRKDNNEDVFVHRSAITGSTMKSPSLRNGEEVEFAVVKTNHGFEAANVTGPNGGDVQGFKSRRPRTKRKPRPPSKQEEGDDIPDQAEGPANGLSKPRRQRRGPRKPAAQNGMVNGDANGTHSENEVYYEAGERSTSPNVGQTRPAPRRPRNGQEDGMNPRRGGGTRGRGFGYGGRRGSGRAPGGRIPGSGGGNGSFQPRSNGDAPRLRGRGRAGGRAGAGNGATAMSSGEGDAEK